MLTSCLNPFKSLWKAHVSIHSYWFASVSFRNSCCKWKDFWKVWVARSCLLGEATHPVLGALRIFRYNDFWKPSLIDVFIALWKADVQVMCWGGYNIYGQLDVPRGGVTDRSSPSAAQACMRCTCRQVIVTVWKHLFGILNFVTCSFVHFHSIFYQFDRLRANIQNFYDIPSYNITDSSLS